MATQMEEMLKELESSFVATGFTQDMAHDLVQRMFKGVTNESDTPNS